MKQARKERQQAAIREEIKAMARAQMAHVGAAALSLRAVASAMGLSSAAIYYYYANRDALITDLIIDAFRSLGVALAAADPGPEQPIATRLYRVLSSYRTWALTTPAEFELIFGAPIPGYQAPAALTAPAARSSLSVIGALFGVAWAEGHLRSSLALVPLPPTIGAHIATWTAQLDQILPTEVMVATHQAWALGHGLVALELNGQLHPTLGDPGAFFDHSLRWMLATFGLTPPAP